MANQTASPDSPVEQIAEAIRVDDAGLVRRLIEQHPEFKALVNEPLGPFDSPAIVNVRSRAMLDALLDAGADLNARSNWWAGGFGLLHCASPQLAAYAMERGAVVDVHAAARLGMLDQLQELVSRNPALVHARGGDGQTPLHFAGAVEVAEYLLDQGAVIDERDVDHESTAAQYMTGDRHALVRYLISRGCGVDILMASAVGDLDLVRRLLVANPDRCQTRVSDEFFPMVNPHAGGTIYQWTLGFHVSAHQVARKFGHEDVFEFLWERSPASTRLLNACWLDDEAAVRKVLAEHPTVAGDLGEADRRQVAHAARNNDTNVLRLMLECGLPVDATGQHQGTPLHWAAYHGNAEMARMLLELHPPLEVEDADFKGTPLGWAIHGSEHGWRRETGDYAATVASLLQAGATPPAAAAGSAAVREVLHRGR